MMAAMREVDERHDHYRVVDRAARDKGAQFFNAA
jgi:hypothetical protein